jgi:hypothetical protein
MKTYSRQTLQCSLLLLVICSCAAAGAEQITVLDPPEAGFFSKQVISHGVPIKAHKDVSDDALGEAARRIGRLLENLPEAAANLTDVGSEVQIIGKDQAVSDLPELRQYKGKPWSTENGKSLTIDERTRGVGGLHASCGEENLLKLPSDRYKDHRDICSHEFAHTLLAHGLTENVRARVRIQYEKSKSQGLWKTAYASTNYDEFFAELTMWYFDSRGDYGKIDPKPQEGREWLRQYDPQAFAMMDDIYAGRMKVQRTKWDLLPARPAAEEGTLRSRSSQEAARIAFVNQTPDEIRLYWIDQDGKRKAYGVVASGQREVRETYVNHSWIVVRADGTVAGIFVAIGRRGRAVVR